MTNFAAVRLIAALAVVLGHSFVLAGLPPPMLLGTPIHVLAVRVFFVVSGYLVCSSWQRDPHLPRFLARRALRIMPGLIAVVLLTVGVLGPAMTRLPLATYAQNPVTLDYLWNLALAPRFALPGVFEDGRAFTAANGALWSLPVEVAMYLLLPLYIWWRAALPVVIAMAIAAAIAFTVIWPDQVQPVFYATSLPFSLRFAADFVIGAAVCRAKLERLLNPQTALLLAAIAQACTFAPLLAALVGAVALPYAVLAFSLAPRPIFGWLDRRADLSYGIYLWGGPVQQVTLSALGIGAGWLGITGVALPFIVALASLSWCLVERPALRWKPLVRKTPTPDTGQVTAVTGRMPPGTRLTNHGWR